MPLVSQTFDQLLDFTRTTSGTFVGSNGLIQNTPASRNLLTQTQQFDNAVWTNGSITIGANITAAPDGTNTADKLQENTTSVSQFFARETYASFVAGTYAMSFYAKAAERTWTYFELGNTYANVNLSTGEVGSTGQFASGWTFVSASTTSVGNGWYRCSIVATCTIAGSYPGIKAHISTSNNGFVYAGTIGSGIYVWGAQLEAASAATTYTRNNGGVYPPRFDYDPVTLAPKGILIEEQRTNLLTYSEQFDNAAWVKNGATVAANTTTSPDGTTNADRMTEVAISGEHYTSQQIAKAASNITYTYSVYFKNGSGTRNFGLGITDGATGGYGAIFSTSGAIVSASFAIGVTTGWTPVSSGVVPAGNGWYRAFLTVTSNLAIRLDGVCYLASGTTTSYAGDGTSNIFIYGAQLEAGAFATSYIPTVASQVTRTADQTSIVAPNFAPWYNAAEGTFVADFDVLSVANTNQHNIVALYTTGTNDMRIWLWEGQPTIVRWGVTNGTGQADITSSAVTANTTVKAAVAYKLNDFAASYNGAATVTDTSGTVPTGFSQLSIGTYTGPTGVMCGHIRSIRYYPTRLSNAQLQALTA